MKKGKGKGARKVKRSVGPPKRKPAAKILKRAAAKRPKSSAAKSPKKAAQKSPKRPNLSRRRFLSRRRRRLSSRLIRRRMGPVMSQAKQAAPPTEPVVEEKQIKVSGKRQVLLCPGPVNTTQQVKSALGGPDICHREPEFSNMMESVRAKLVHALGLDASYTAAIISGSGTAALEAAVLASMDPGKKLLVINNGVYGSRIAQIARIHGIPLVEVRSTLTDAPDLARVKAALKRESGVGTVAMVHHETSTGMLNPVEAVGLLAKKARKRFLVDAISSLGAEGLDLAKHHIGLCVGSAGKALHGAPGLSFVLVTHAETARILKMKPRSLYLGLGLALKSQEEGEPPFTPAVPLISAFHVALSDLVKEGVKNRISKYKQRAVFLRTGFKKMGLELLLDEKILSNSLTALKLPPQVSYKRLHQLLKRSGFIIYAGQSELKDQIFRVAHMGGLLQSDLKTFLAALKAVLAKA